MQPNYEKYVAMLTGLLYAADETTERALMVLLNVTEDVKNVLDCKLYNNIFPLLNTLTTICLECQNITLIRTFWVVVINLLNICGDPELAYNYILHLIEKHATFASKSERDKSMLSGMMSAMYSGLLAMRNCCPQEAFFKQVYEFTIRHFMNIKDVDSDGFYVISGLSIVYKRAFEKVFDDFWPYLIHGLKKVTAFHYAAQRAQYV